MLLCLRSARGPWEKNHALWLLLELQEQVPDSPFLRVRSWAVICVYLFILANLYWLVTMEISAGHTFMSERDFRD